MELRLALLEILGRAFPTYEALRVFVYEHEPTLPQQAVVILDARSLAELLVEDVIERGKTGALVAALRQRQPALGPFIDEQLARVPAEITIQPALGSPASPSPAGSPPYLEHKLPPRIPGTGYVAAPHQSSNVRRPDTEDKYVESRGPEQQPQPHAKGLGPIGDKKTPAPPPSLAPPQRLSLGFAPHDQPAAPFLTHRTLARAQRYLLWVTLSPEEIAASISRADPMHGLRYGDELDVIVFPFPDQLILEGPRHGRVRLDATGNQIVTAAYSAAPAAPATLYFSVRSPDTTGRHALRVHVYCRGVLLQSHLVTAEVAEHSIEQPGALGRKLDYNLSTSLDAARIGPRDRCDVSFFLNDDGHGTHSFRFVSSSKDGVPDSIGDAHLDGAQLANAVHYARGGLRWAAWGTEEPWDGKRSLRFTATLDRPTLESVVLELAIRGANLYLQLATQFSFVGPAGDQLREHMRLPGQVQLALKESVDAIFPIALVYDYPLDTELKKHRVCADAIDAIASGRQLDLEPCFRGSCPSYQRNDVICPGGFWGFRHDLGLPLHLRKGEVATKIPRGQQTRAFAAVSTDPKLTLRDAHLGALGKLGTNWLEILDERDACLARLTEPRQLVYFYCHGGLSAMKLPYLQVGDPDSPNISAQVLQNARIYWPEPLRPLVILNGCHTTATAADEMFSMLTAFAAQCNAAGVIGTEIINFELIAKTFAEKLVDLFLFKGERLGRAVRLARLELLRAGNPLGLMYISFALPSLQLA